MKVKQVGSGYDVVLDDGDELVLAHYEPEPESDEPQSDLRTEAERYAAEVQMHLVA